MASKEIKISEVRSCSAQCNDDKSNDPLKKQGIKLKPINQLTNSPVPEQITQKIVHKTVGNTTISVLTQDDPKTGRVQTINGRQFVLKKITKENIQKSSKPPPGKIIVQRNEDGTFSSRIFEPRKLESNGQRAGPKSASMPQRVQIITIDGLTEESISKLPPQVITFIKKLQSENTMLKRMLMDFRNETVGIANHLLKFSHEINSSITVSKSLANEPKKRKFSPPSATQPTAQEPEQKKVKKTIRMPKFPINTVQCLSTFENDLKIQDFHEFVFQRLESHLKSRNDITQENLFDSVLSSMINVDVLGELSYDQNTNSISSYQLCFRVLEKFRELYSQLLSAFSTIKFKKIVDSKEIEEFLQRKVLMRGKILQYQKNTEKGSPNIRITKIKVKESQQEKSDKEMETGGPNFRWVDDSDNEAI